MDKQERCALSVCGCLVSRGHSYCSVDCEQAAAQGVDRNYCQCFHRQCSSEEQTPVDGLHISDFISLAPGRVIIECFSIESLREQLVLLSAALNRDADRVRVSIEPSLRRQPGRIVSSFKAKTA